jgi:hypothetical protein
MGKLKDLFFGTSDKRKKIQRRLKIQKNALQKQKESNKKMRAFYQKRNLDEIKLRKTSLREYYKKVK